MSNIKNKKWISVVIVGLTTWPSLVSAEDKVLLGHTSARNLASHAGLGGASGSTDLYSVIGTMINAFLGLLGVVFLLLIIYAGILYMTAGGNAEQTKKAKGYLTNSIIGLAVIMTAYAITTYIFSQLASSVFGS